MRGKFGESANLWRFVKLKPSKLVLTINNLLADLLIHQTCFCQMLEKSKFTRLPRYTVLGTNIPNDIIISLVIPQNEYSILVLLIEMI